MFKITVQSKKTDAIILKLAATSNRLAADLQNYAPEIAEVAGELIIAEIREKLPEGIGDFMANRTKVEATYSGTSILLTISGMTEGEAGHPASRSGVPRAKDGANLWLTHEFGRPTSGTLGNYQKDVGGVTSIRSTRSLGSGKYGRGSPYVGAIRNMIPSITAQLNIALRPVGAIAANNVLADYIETGTRGRVKIDRSARAALNRAGIGFEALAAIGVVRVSVSSTGQINLLGSTGGSRRHFISGKGLGVPTTIRT